MFANKLTTSSFFIKQFEFSGRKYVIFFYEKENIIY